MGLLQKGLRRAVVKPAAAKLAYFVSMSVKYPSRRPVLNMIPQILRPPAEVNVLPQVHVFLETRQLFKNGLPCQEIA